MTRIVADREISAVGNFSCLGELTLFDGREISPEIVADAEILLVRSVSNVSGELLEGSSVRFVGTATAGTDHVDSAWLEENGVSFFAASGCNAPAVADYVITCLTEYAERSATALTRLTVGIIGCGHVGNALATRLRRCGIRLRQYDPPRADRDPSFASDELDAALDCDVVTLHVPLIESGAWKTRNLLGPREISKLRPGTLVINAARGGVLDEAALLRRLASANDLLVAVDCWENEPAINEALLAKAWFSTPHIAGHTHQARLEASRLLYCRLSEHFAGMPKWAGSDLERSHLKLQGAQTAAEVVRMVCRLPFLTERMHTLAHLAPAQRAGAFDTMRREHGLREQFSALRIAPGTLPAETAALLEKLEISIAET